MWKNQGLCSLYGVQPLYCLLFIWLCMLHPVLENDVLQTLVLYSVPLWTEVCITEWELVGTRWYI